jgi:hypothetical protein
MTYISITDFHYKRSAFGKGDVPAESIYEIVRLAKPG